MGPWDGSLTALTGPPSPMARPSLPYQFLFRQYAWQSRLAGYLGTPQQVPQGCLGGPWARLGRRWRDASKQTNSDALVDLLALCVRRNEVVCVIVL